MASEAEALLAVRLLTRSLSYLAAIGTTFALSDLIKGISLIEIEL